MARAAPPLPKPPPKPPSIITGNLRPSRVRAAIGRIFAWFIAGDRLLEEWRDREAASRLGLPENGRLIAQPPSRVPPP